MQLVIDIPENTYKQIQALARNNYFEHDICGNSMRRIANGTPIPEGATNGDMIKAMFPNISIYEHGSTYSINNEYDFNSTWWNAPYKAKSER